jgi:hypothetical protein
MGTILQKHTLSKQQPPSRKLLRIVERSREVEILSINKLSDSEWAVMLELCQFALEAKDDKIPGLKVKMNAMEIEDCRNIIRKAKEHL